MLESLINQWETELFDEYNGEQRLTVEDHYGQLDDTSYGGYDSAEEGDCFYDPILKKKHAYTDRNLLTEM